MSTWSWLEAEETIVTCFGTCVPHQTNFCKKNVKREEKRYNVFIMYVTLYMGVMPQ